MTVVSRDLRVPPFLAHLRRDRRGIPVPWINHWGVENVERVRLAHDPHVNGLAVFHDDDPIGDPDFTRQNMARQRQSAVGSICQVCGKRVPWSQRSLVIGGVSLETIRLGSHLVPVVVEPWLHDRCARFAVSRCPALIRRDRADQLTVYPVRSKRECLLVISKGWVEGPLEAQSRDLMPVMWVKIAIYGLTATT